MSAHLTDSHALAEDAVADLFGFSLEAIRKLQQELKEARALLAERDAEIEMLRRRELSQ